jgi:hypothetical protein
MRLMGATWRAERLRQCDRNGRARARQVRVRCPGAAAASPLVRRTVRDSNVLATPCKRNGPGKRLYL